MTPIEVENQIKKLVAEFYKCLANDITPSKELLDEMAKYNSIVRSKEWEL